MNSVIHSEEFYLKHKTLNPKKKKKYSEFMWLLEVGGIYYNRYSFKRMF